jgi:hypothetical protein
LEGGGGRVCCREPLVVRGGMLGGRGGILSGRSGIFGGSCGIVLVGVA